MSARRRALGRLGWELVRELALETVRTAGANLGERLVPARDKKPPGPKKDDDEP